MIKTRENKSKQNIYKDKKREETNKKKGQKKGGG